MNVIITGATGMVGEGVLDTCLKSPEVKQILVVTRKKVDAEHPKLKQIVVDDFFNTAGESGDFSGYDACFFCLGKSSLGIKKQDYTRITYDLTMHFARILAERNQGMTFCYVSGQGTDGTEKSMTHWARVKGKTENDLRKFPFRQVFAYRPGFIQPIPGLNHSLSFYKYINWLFPIGKKLMPQWFNTLEEVGLSMISVTKNGYESFVLQGKDITLTAKRI